MDDPELHSTIQSATNKSEAFKAFAKWAFLGGEGVITENRRIEQRKRIKFNHLVANILLFDNVHVISEALYQLNQEGAQLDEQVVAALWPYMRHHINRFGHYQLDLTQPPPTRNYDIQVVTSRPKREKHPASQLQQHSRNRSRSEKRSNSLVREGSFNGHQ